MTHPVTPPTATPRPTVRLQYGHERRLHAGHPWAYSNEITMDAAAKAIPPGTVVELARSDGKRLASAFFNPHSLIAARLLGPPDLTVDAAFLAQRLGAAVRLRERLGVREFCRLVHAEGDGLPGLIVDAYGRTLVVQVNSAGMDRLEADLLVALDEVLDPAVVVLRNDGRSRGLEGLTNEVRVAKGALDGPVELRENGQRFWADAEGGQKTGWYYDQRDNRAFVAGLVRGGRVLDLYCYSGGFTIPAAVNADRVVAVDRSAAALDLARRAAEAAGVAARVDFREAEVFEALAKLSDAGNKFDVVIADPPPFARSKREVPTGLKGYRKLADLSARLVTPGGFLAICSCSHNVFHDEFREQVARGLARAERTGRILRDAGAAPDHPVHPMLPETAYLKCLVLQVD